MDNREKIASEIELIILRINCLYNTKDYDSIMSISSIPEQKCIILKLSKIY